jgi:16S rRNA C967 or C1407 C5-methylase (RsmB/RsmF family)
MDGDGLPALQISDDLRAFLMELPDIECDRLISCYESSMPESFRVNTLKTEPSVLIPILEEEGFEVRPLPWVRDGYLVRPEGRLSHSIWYKLGLVYIQGAVSMLASELLDIAPGHIVLDMCAAPGSKSTHIAQLLGGRGVIVANDVSTTRVKALASNLQRCGVVNSIIT